MRRTAWLILVALIISALLPMMAMAEETEKKKEFNDYIVVIQRKPYLRKGRVELMPTFHGSFNDSLAQQLSVGASINYHIAEWIYAGVTGGWQDWRFMSRDATGFTSTYEQVIDATDAIPEVSVIDAFVGGVVGFIPVYGKLALFNSSIVHWDISVGIGGGAIHTRANGLTGGGVLTVGERLFLLDWLSISGEVRGYFYPETLNQSSGLFTQWQAGVGVSFWLPTSFEYESD